MLEELFVLFPNVERKKKKRTWLTLNVQRQIADGK
jgi:hypothetical protein